MTHAFLFGTEAADVTPFPIALDRNGFEGGSGMRGGIVYRQFHRGPVTTRGPATKDSGVHDPG
jgi:hypothetical protein